MPVFEELAKRVDLTVLYSNGDLPANIGFKVIKMPTAHILKYSWYKGSLCGLAKGFDAVLAPLDFSNLSLIYLSKTPRPFKTIYWSIGVPASYKVPYDTKSSYDSKFLRQIKRSDAVVFYCSYPVEKYAKMGISRDKLFVANNTVEVLPTSEHKEKNTIIFLGSLYKQKRIFDLLENYKAAYTERQDIPELIVIGEGDQRSAVEKWIAENGLSAKIRLTGGIYDEACLSAYFASAIACISPGQAGLTVLKSMGYGVPFVTTKDAVTGGEIFNITDNVNGLVLDNYNEMKSVILETLTNRDRFITMGQAAREFYEENRQIGMMVDGFEQAINFVFNKGR